MHKHRVHSRWRMVGNWATAWRAWGCKYDEKTESAQGGNMRKAHLGIGVSRVNAIRFSQWFTEAKERSNSARRKKKDWPSRQWAAIELNLWHVSLSLDLLMYIYMFSKLKCHDLKWLRTGTEIEFTGLWKPYICIWRNKLVWIADTPFFLSLYWRKLNFEVFWLISV